MNMMVVVKKTLIDIQQEFASFPPATVNAIYSLFANLTLNDNHGD